MCWQSSRFALLLLRPGHSDSDTRTKDSRTQDTRRKDDTETKDFTLKDARENRESSNSGIL